MAVSRQKCPSCGAALQYNSATRMWDCAYCGGSYRIRESQTGPYSIKNVAGSALLNAAKGLFDQARRDLAEAEKLDPRHPAVLAARIGVNHARLTRDAAAPAAELSAMYDQLKRDRADLCAGGPAEQDDEEALYESLPEAACLAVLLLAYADLGMTDREAALRDRLTVEKVYHPAVNQALFRYFLKHGDDAALHRVLENRANLDLHEAMLDLLAAADCPQKADWAAPLMRDGALGPDDRPAIEQYLNGPDSAVQKAALTRLFCAAGLRPPMACVVDSVLTPLPGAEAPALLEALCARRLYEEDLRVLLHYAFTQAPLDVLEAVFDALDGAEQYVKLDPRQVSAFLARTGVPVPRRLALFRKMWATRAVPRAAEQIFTEYLLHTADAPDDRAEMLDVLIDLPEKFSPPVFEEYLTACPLDTDCKAGIAQTMVDKGINPAAIRGLLGSYMASNVDSDEVRQDVLDLLLDCGLTLAPGELMDYLCGAPDAPDVKLALLGRMRGNGAVLPANALSTYLERVGPESFRTEMLHALYSDVAEISDTALTRYLLYCPDDAAVKAGNALALAARNGAPFGTQTGTAYHLGRPVCGCLMQLYLLCARDDAATAAAVTEAMRQAKARWNGDLTVDGCPVKFKKYVQEHRAQLSPLALQLCEENHVFSFF